MGDHADDLIAVDMEFCDAHGRLEPCAQCDADDAAEASAEAHAQQLAAAERAVLDAAVRRRSAEKAFRDGADPIGKWRAWKDAEVAEDAAVDALNALRGAR